MYKLSRDEYRNIKNMSKETMEKWLSNRNASMYNQLRKVFEKEYQDEIDCTINNFLIAIAYTLVFTEEINLEKGAAAGVIEDLLVTVDMFKTGEYKSEDYEKALKEEGVSFEKYDYSKVYRNKEGTFEKANKKAIKWIENFIGGSSASCNLGDLQLLENILKGGYKDVYHIDNTNNDISTTSSDSQAT